jgi:hypothetical protein
MTTLRQRLDMLGILLRLSPIEIDMVAASRAEQIKLCERYGISPEWLLGAPILRNGRRSVADARLIAAAPDMLVALQNLTTNITQHQQLMDVVELSTFEAALAAIAKATREAPWSETERLT